MLQLSSCSPIDPRKYHKNKLVKSNAPTKQVEGVEVGTNSALSLPLAHVLVSQEALSLCLARVVGVAGVVGGSWEAVLERVGISALKVQGSIEVWTIVVTCVPT